ncbi:MAG TPA: hypothetical protein VFZ66_13670 [Herpetosiphonaceae bacterium]
MAQQHTTVRHMHLGSRDRASQRSRANTRDLVSQTIARLYRQRGPPHV